LITLISFASVVCQSYKLKISCWVVSKIYIDNCEPGSQRLPVFGGHQISKG